MEDLNKNQIVLLTLLVSFVTSIATGIITVSLLQEAPIEVTRNINRIVEKTIETVTTPTNPTNPTPTTQKEVTTVVVKEEDLIIDSINKNLQSVARIEEKDPIAGTTTFVSIGLVVTKDGLISSDRKTITSGNTYIAIMSDGTEIKLTPVGVDKQTDVLLFKPLLSEASTTKAYTFVPVKFADSDPQLGQTVISLAGDDSNSVAIGRITSFDTKETGTGTSTTKYISSINTTFGTKDFTSGSPIFNLSGDVIGVKVTSLSNPTFTPVDQIKKEVNSLISGLKSS